MKITFDTNSVESLNAVDEQIKKEIARIEKDGRNAKKNKEKTKTVYKTDKVAVPITDADVNTYKSLLGLQEGIKHALKAIPAIVLDEQNYEVREETENRDNNVEQTTTNTPILEDKKDDSLVVTQAAEENISDDKLLDDAVAAEDKYFRLLEVIEKSKREIAAKEEKVNKAKEEYQRLLDQIESKYPSVKVDPDSKIAKEQLDAARKDFVSFLGNATQMLNQKELQARLEAEQKKAAASDVKAVAENSAKKAEEAKRLAAIYAQQGLAAGADLVKVAESRAAKDGATPEDIANVQKAKDAAHANNIGKDQSLVAADHVLNVANQRKKVAEQAERDAKIVAEQQNAAYADVKKVVDSRYGKIKGEIVQDLPIKSKEEQHFNTPGMTDEQIAASRAKIASVPEYTAPKEETWQQMSNAINNLMIKRSHNDKNLNGDDTKALYYLLTHPESAPSKEFITDLLIWSGIAPLERSTPSHTKPAVEQEKPVNKDSEVIADPTKKDEVRTVITDKEIERTRSEEDKRRAGKTSGVTETSTKSTSISEEDMEKTRKYLDEQRKAKEEAEKRAALSKTTGVKQETPKTELFSKKGGKHLRKVTNKEVSKTKASKKSLINKFMNLGRSVTFISIRDAINALRKTYKDNDVKTNETKINELYRKLYDAKNDLKPLENKLLYSNLVKVNSKIESFNAKKKAETPVKDDLTAEEHANIASTVEAVQRQKAEEAKKAAAARDAEAENTDGINFDEFFGVLDEEGHGRR